MSDSFNRAWDVLKMPPNMFDEEPGAANNPITQPLHPWTSRLQGMEPEMLSMLLNANEVKGRLKWTKSSHPTAGGQ